MTDNALFLDQLLDQSLARYSAAEPRSGLEQRILARLEAGDFKPASWWQWRWLRVVAAVAAVMVIAAALVFVRREAAPAPPMVASQATTTPPPVPTAAVKEPAVIPVASVPRIARPAVTTLTALPRAEHFPRPARLTEEERLLQQYLDSTPRELLVASVSTYEPLGDVRVPDLEVFPLELKELPDRSGETIED